MSTYIEDPELELDGYLHGHPGQHLTIDIWNDPISELTFVEARMIRYGNNGEIQLAMSSGYAVDDVISGVLTRLAEKERDTP